MGFKIWFEALPGFDITQPMNWRPHESQVIVWIERDAQTNTPRGMQHLFIVYAIVRFRPPYRDTKGEIEPTEVIQTYPVVQFDPSYIKAAVLTGPRGSKDKDSLEWAWREFRSNHNQFSILSPQIKNQVELICDRKAEEYLDGMEPEDWEAPED